MQHSIELSIERLIENSEPAAKSLRQGAELHECCRPQPGEERIRLWWSTDMWLGHVYTRRSRAHRAGHLRLHRSRAQKARLIGRLPKPGEFFFRRLGASDWAYPPVRQVPDESGSPCRCIQRLPADVMSSRPDLATAPGASTTCIRTCVQTCCTGTRADTRQGADMQGPRI